MIDGEGGYLKGGWRESALVPCCVVCGMLYMVGANVVALWWRWRAVRYTSQAGESSPTTMFYLAVYAYLAGSGAIHVVLGLWLSYFRSPQAWPFMFYGIDSSRPSPLAPAPTHILPKLCNVGVVVGIPPITVAVLGRDAVFKWAARKFDDENATSDGAFVAELLSTATASVGEKWWIKRTEPLTDLPDDGLSGSAPPPRSLPEMPSSPPSSPELRVPTTRAQPVSVTPPSLRPPTHPPTHPPTQTRASTGWLESSSRSTPARTPW